MQFQILRASSYYITVRNRIYILFLLLILQCTTIRFPWYLLILIAPKISLSQQDVIFAMQGEGEEYFINLQRVYKTRNSGVSITAQGKILLLCNMVVEEGGVVGCWQKNQSTCAEPGKARQLERENLQGRYLMACILHASQCLITIAALCLIGSRQKGRKSPKQQQTVG